MWNWKDKIDVLSKKSDETLNILSDKLEDMHERLEKNTELKEKLKNADVIVTRLVIIIGGIFLIIYIMAK